MEENKDLIIEREIDVDLKYLESFSSFIPLREAVFQTLKKAILNGTLKPRQLLSENKIAQKMSVSRTPVREALRILEMDNLVTILPGRKVIVSTPNVQDIEDIYEIRFIVEIEALKRITPDQVDVIQQLQNYVDAAKEHLNNNELDKLGQTNTKYHLTIISALNNKRLQTFIDALHDTIYRFRIFNLTDKPWPERALREHQEIISALQLDDRERAVSILRQHLIIAKETLLTFLKEEGVIDPYK